MASKAAVENLSTIFSAGPSTMTPFLYQTRTLSSLHWTRSRSIVQSQLGESRRLFSSSIARPVVQANRDETTTASATQEERQGPTIRRTTVMRGSEPKFSGDYYGKNTSSRNVARKPQKEGPIMRSVFAPGDTDRQVDTWWDKTTEMIQNDFEDVESSDLYEAEDDIFDDENEMDAWTRQSNPSQDRQTTITPSERAAFETIFANIRDKTRNAQRYGAIDENERTTGPAARQRAKTKLENILGNAMSAVGQQTRQEMETIVNRYPPPLRALAAKAVGLDFDESHFEETAEEEETMDNDQLEELRKPIREEVEARMHAAETDVELWAVMEEKVFPLIEKLGLEGAGRKEKPLKKRGKKPRISSKESPRKLVLPSEEEQAGKLEPIIHDGQVVSPLALYGPLYPSYLLLGFRLLDRSFAKPSPLTLSVLPKIKSLGLISHVLGASTQLYNELLIIHWYRHDDFRGTLDLLNEIELSGLNFNKETLEIIDDIMRMQGRILKGARGPTLQMLWSLPEFAPGKFGYWQKKITKMLNEKEHVPGRLSY